MIQIDNGRIFINGAETIDAALIGYAVLDAVEDGDIIICTRTAFDKEAASLADVAFNAGVTAGQIIESLPSKLQ